MLSIANISSSGAALSYYEEDDYYTKGSPEHQDLSLWLGKASLMLGLKGNVQRDDFKGILEGRLPNGEIVGVKNQDGSIKHAVGIDMTFSAPKSVSIVSEVLKDKSVLDIHREAVKNALRYAENNFISTRIKENGKTTKQEVKEMVAASFTHNTSRKLDPQLHTHCVVANMVKRQDGKWRSAWFGDIFENKKLLGAIYRAELANGLAKKGYEINRTHEDGRFEVVGVPQDLMKAFSTRSQEIRSVLEKYDFQNAKTAADAALRTREVKVGKDRESLDKIWEDVVKNVGYNSERLLSSLKDRENDKSINAKGKNRSFLEEKWDKFVRFLGFNDSRHISQEHDNAESMSSRRVAKESIKYAICHLGERESVFAKKDLLVSAIGYGVGRTSIGHIEKELSNSENKGDLLASKKKGLSGKYTTIQEIEKEKSSIRMMKQGQQKVKSIASENKELHGALKESNLNRNQRAAAQFALTSKDRVVAIQGYAGVGKTYTLDFIREKSEKGGYKMLGIAPSASAASSLQDGAKIPSQTIHKFLFKYEGLINDRGTAQGLQKMKSEMKDKIIVLDEASLASTNQINSLLKVVQKLESRLIMVGDVKQLDAVESGKPFEQLQRAGMKTVVMDEIIRQRDMELKSVVESVTRGDVTQAFQRLDDSKGSIIETKSENIASKAVEEYFKIKGGDRSNSLILTPANETRNKVNLMVRGELKSKGELGSKDSKIEALKQKNLTKVQKTNSDSYQKDNVVLFNRGYKSLKVKKDEYLEVIGSNQKGNLVYLRSKEGRVVEWNPQKVAGSRVGAMEVLEKNPLNISIGEKIAFKKNSSTLSEVINSGMAIVQDIKNDHISLKMDNDKEFILRTDSKEMKHIDYGYATTVHSAQGKTANHVIAIAESYREHLLNQKSFYVTISRAKDSVCLIVDDKQKVAEKLHDHTGERFSALESQRIHERGVGREM